jgi:hypothetical protein
VREGGFFPHFKSYCFGQLKPHGKFHNPRTTPSGKKEPEQRERRKKENKTSLMVAAKSHYKSSSLIQYQ